jgi:hypothetical protein
MATHPAGHGQRREDIQVFNVKVSGLPAELTKYLHNLLTLLPIKIVAYDKTVEYDHM